MKRMIPLSILGMIFAAVILTSCSKDNPLTIAPDAGAVGNAQNQLTGAKLSAEERQQLIDNIPNKGEWVKHENLEAYIAYRKQYRLDELFGDETVKRIIDSEAREEQSKNDVTRIDPEKQGYYRNLFIQAMQAEGVGESEQSKNLEFYDRMVERHLRLQNKKSKQSSASDLAYAPDLYGEVQATCLPVEVLISDPVFATATMTNGIYRPSSYEQRGISNWGWYIVQNQEVAFVEGEILLTFRNTGCVDSLGNPRINVVWSNFSTKTSSKNRSWSPGMCPGTTIRSSQWKSWADAYLYHYGWDSWTQSYITAPPYPCTTVYGPEVTYNMGGRGEMDGNNRYDVADVNRCLFFWADPSTANAYERFAGDANVDGSSFNVADVMQIVYQALGLGPCN